MSITKVIPVERVGRVKVFDVTPYRKVDPPLVVCASVDLGDYYYLWSKAVSLSHSYDDYGEGILSLYTKMMKALNISNLCADEASFLIVELLKFKNEYVRRIF